MTHRQGGRTRKAEIRHLIEEEFSQKWQKSQNLNRQCGDKCGRMKLKKTKQKKQGLRVSYLKTMKGWNRALQLQRWSSGRRPYLSESPLWPPDPLWSWRKYPLPGEREYQTSNSHTLICLKYILVSNYNFYEGKWKLLLLWSLIHGELRGTWKWDPEIKESYFTWCQAHCSKKVALYSKKLKVVRPLLSPYSLWSSSVTGRKKKDSTIYALTYQWWWTAEGSSVALSPAWEVPSLPITFYLIVPASLTFERSVSSSEKVLGNPTSTMGTSPALRANLPLARVPPLSLPHPAHLCSPSWEQVILSCWALVSLFTCRKGAALFRDIYARQTCWEKFPQQPHLG